MSKISELSDGGVIQGGDTLIAVRSGGNVKVTYGGTTTANIDGGTIDGTVIGGTTPAAGSFTTGSFTGSVSADGLTVDGSAVVRSGNTLTLNRTDNAIGGAMSYVAGTGFIFNDANGDGTNFNVGATTRLRIDSAGNVLVGKSSSSFTTAGVELAQGGTAGKVQIMRSSGALTVVNTTDDGSAISIYKGTSPVGSIGTKSGNPFIANASTGIKFTNEVEPCDNNGADADTFVDLGSSSNRFGNLYLSGTLNGISTTKSTSGNCWGILPEVEGNGVMEIGRYIDFHSTNADTSDYGARLDFDGTNLISTAPIRASGGVRLGGQGAANTLDDYEEGTWIGSATAGASSALNVVDEKYTKIGNQVTIQCTINFSGASGSLTVSGLPFAPSPAAVGIGREDATSGYAVYCRVQASSTSFDVFYAGGISNATPFQVSAGNMRISMTYLT